MKEVVTIGVYLTVIKEGYTPKNGEVKIVFYNKINGGGTRFYRDSLVVKIEKLLYATREGFGRILTHPLK